MDEIRIRKLTDCKENKEITYKVSIWKRIKD